MKIVTDQEITQIINDQEQVGWQQVLMVLRMVVKDVDEQGVASVDFTLKRFGLTVTPPKGPVMEYDSANPPGEVPLRASGLAAMVGHTYSITYARDGHGANVEGMGELLRAMMDAIPEAAAPIREEMTDGIEKRCATLEQRAKYLFDIYPAGPVGIGDSWAKTSQLPVPLPMTVDTRYILVSRKDGIVHIVAEMKITIDPDAGPIKTGPAEMTLVLLGPVRTKQAIDEKTGLIVRSETEQAFKSTITTDGPPGSQEKMIIPMRLKAVGTFELLKAK